MEHIYDVVIIGGGPAGLTGALYLARARYDVLVIEKEEFGGKITLTEDIANYPGVANGTGKEIANNMRRQAESFGSKFMISEVNKVDLLGDVKTVYTNQGEIKCYGIIIATGSNPRKLGFKGEDEFIGHGVAHCATCDGEFFTNKHVFVLGGGFAAAEESIFLTRFAKHVTVLFKTDDFTCAKAVAEPVYENKKITVIPNILVEEVTGDKVVRTIKYKNMKTGEVTEYKEADGDNIGVFVFEGYKPATELFEGIIETNAQGYVVTDKDLKTSVNGVYAAGDVCIKSLRQIVTAVNDGALAATELEKYVTDIKKKKGISTQPSQNNKNVVQNTSSVNKSQVNNGDNKLFTEDMLAQLNSVFSKMESPVVLKLYLDNKEISNELRNYINSLAELTDKISVVENKENLEDVLVPCVKICKKDGTWSGLSFHGVPGGHEFTSFILGLYNVSGPGQSIDVTTLEEVKKLPKTSIKILVSLSCTICPEVVVNAQRIASLNPNVTAEVYDFKHFLELKDKFDVLSVPCIVINEEDTTFGRKSISQLIEYINLSNN